MVKNIAAYYIGRDVESWLAYLETYCQYYPSLHKKNAVTLMGHGLNVKPKAMEPLIHLLTGSGSDVYLIQLSGHLNKSKPISAIDPAIWKKEMLLGYEHAKKAAAELNLPLYFLGYSLGALLGQTAVQLPFKGKGFEKQVLIAPAFGLRRRSYLLKYLFFLGRNSFLPSLAPVEYRVNDALPLSVYQLLLREEKCVWNAMTDQLNIPTLVIIDPKDELISYKRLLNCVNSLALSNYRMLPVNSNIKGRKGHYHHLLLDQSSMGIENWRLVATAIQQFLFNK